MSMSRPRRSSPKTHWRGRLISYCSPPRPTISRAQWRPSHRQLEPTQRDPPAVERHSPFRRLAGALRRHACPRRPMPDLDDARSGRSHRASQRCPHPDIRGAERVVVYSIKTISAELSGARFEARSSNAILQEMCEKRVFIAASVGITRLMRAAIGAIVAAGAADLATGLLAECTAIAAKEGFRRGRSSPRTGTMQAHLNSADTGCCRVSGCSRPTVCR